MSIPLPTRATTQPPHGARSQIAALPALTGPRPGTVAPVRDASGYAVFAAGETGYAHVLAHKMLDSGQLARGRRLLGSHLNTIEGSRSERVHLQWHMAVFELELGEWDAAYARFERCILPVAANTEDALTDGPALLWRLALARPASVALPWSALHHSAAASLEHSDSHAPYSTLHSLLALAGAGDVAGLDRWLHRQSSTPRTEKERIVRDMAVALRAYAGGRLSSAAQLLTRIVPRIGTVGGSGAQNQLFVRILESARRGRWVLQPQAALARTA